MKSLILFGSKARHESDIGSDIDLLGIYDKDKIKSIIHESVHLFLYPEKLISEMMLSGDLFALHLKQESIPLYGDEHIQEIFKKFTYKDNYSHEINIATFLAYEIAASYESIKNKKEANKKIAWCIRTIIIAKSAENREPVFSKKKLSQYLDIDGVSQKDIEILINIKNFSKGIPSRYIDRLIIFINHFDIAGRDIFKIISDPFIIKSMNQLSSKAISSRY